MENLVAKILYILDIAQVDIKLKKINLEQLSLINIELSLRSKMIGLMAKEFIIV